MKRYTRIYKNYTYGKELIAYKLNDVIIQIENYGPNARGGFTKDYIVPQLKKLGYPSRFETLKEAKQYIEKYI